MLIKFLIHLNLCFSQAILILISHIFQSTDNERQHLIVLEVIIDFKEQFAEGHAALKVVLIIINIYDEGEQVENMIKIEVLYFLKPILLVLDLREQEISTDFTLISLGILLEEIIQLKFLQILSHDQRDLTDLIHLE